MRIKKSYFTKMSMLVLPITIISILTPVVLTSCGSSNSATDSDNKPNNGETSGNTGGTSTKPEIYTATWNLPSSTITGLTIANNRATITLNNDKFYGTSISKTSKYVDIVNSLSPKVSSIKSGKVSKNSTLSTQITNSTKTLYTVLSDLINNVDKFIVKLSIKQNPIYFDFSNDKIGNTFSGQFILTPIANKNSATVATSLDFTINNFNDSNNDSNKLTWKVDEIAKALKSDSTSGIGNNLQEVTPIVPTNEEAAAIIDLSKPDTGKQVPTLSQVMNELSNTTISIDELKSFVKNEDEENYNLTYAKISTWAPTVDYSMVITRIVIPNKDSTKDSAIMYLAYTGYTIDQGNGAWNRNIIYIGASDLRGDLWDKQYNEPVIDLTEVDGSIGDTGISKDLIDRQILVEGDVLSKYIVDNYIIGSENFTIEYDHSWSHASTGRFDNYGKYIADTDPDEKEELLSLKGASKAPVDVLTNNNNVIQIKFFLSLGNNSDGKPIQLPQSLDNKPLNSYESYDGTYGFWKSFYIVGYKTN